MRAAIRRGGGGASSSLLPMRIAAYQAVIFVRKFHAKPVLFADSECTEAHAAAIAGAGAGRTTMMMTTSPSTALLPPTATVRVVRNFHSLPSLAASARDKNKRNNSSNNSVLLLTATGTTPTATAAMSTSTTSPTPTLSIIGRFHKWLSRESTVATADFNRWRVVPASFLVQVSIGSVYAWSFFNEPLSRDFGVVASSARDWDLASIVPIFSCCALTLGVCTAVLGPWAERSGPRMVAFAAANCWAGGLMLTSLGTYTHQLWLCYIGYGMFGGMGWGLGYISPVSTLMKWFPDRRGLATGLALTAFGGGAMLATPINELLFSAYFELPMYLGAASDVALTTEGGVRHAMVDGVMREVIITTAADMSRLPIPAEAGVYVVGTGSSGAAKTFATLAVGYYAAMVVGACGARVPKEGWVPPSLAAKQQQAESSNTTVAAGGSGGGGDEMVTTRSVHFNTALRTPQFYLLWGAVAGNAIAGVSVISCAKTIMSDIFGTTLPLIVTGTFAATFVAALSCGNMVGRFMWANGSDFLGRKPTYFLFGLGAPMCVLIPQLTHMASQGGGEMPLWMFYGCSVILVSFYGGVFSVLPAYLADVFGPKHVGAIHGRALTAWSAAAVGGPAILSYLRDSSYKQAITDLALKVDPAQFHAAFGEPITKLSELVQAKTVTIQTLLQICPVGTCDPTPMLYDTTLYSMGGLLAVALVCNACVRPVNPKHFIEEKVKKGEESDPHAH